MTDSEGGRDRETPDRTGCSLNMSPFVSHDSVM